MPTLSSSIASCDQSVSRSVRIWNIIRLEREKQKKKYNYKKEIKKKKWQLVSTNHIGVGLVPHGRILVRLPGRRQRVWRVYILDGQVHEKWFCIIRTVVPCMGATGFVWRVCIACAIMYA